jgi:hypothetical protein
MPTLSTDIISHAVNSNLVSLKQQTLWKLSLASKELRTIAVKAQEKRERVIGKLIRGIKVIWPKLQFDFDMPRVYVDPTYYALERKYTRLFLEFAPDLNFVRWEYYTIVSCEADEKVEGLITDNDVDSFLIVIRILHFLTQPVKHYAYRFDRIDNLLRGVSFVWPDAIDQVITDAYDEMMMESPVAERKK